MPMTKRTESKKIFRDKILEAAKTLFLSQGFENTTIEQIAEKAGVGLGTAYNYFQSKEELFVLSMVESFEETAESESKLDIENDPAEAVYSAIFSRIKRMNWVNKKLWKIAFPVILSSMRSDKLPITEVMRADFRMIENIHDLLNQMKENGLLNADFDVETANDLIFSAVFYRLSLYIYSDELSFEEVLIKIKLHIEFIFRCN
jgi:AcrR family transcriptional regulator